MAPRMVPAALPLGGHCWEREMPMVAGLTGTALNGRSFGQQTWQKWPENQQFTQLSPIAPNCCLNLCVNLS